jgi:serine/threonine-protein kinase
VASQPIAPAAVAPTAVAPDVLRAQAAPKAEPAPPPKPRVAPVPAAERTARAVKPPAAAPAKAASPLPTGVVQLAIAPWGQIEVNGAPAGVTPPLARLTLPVGEHVVTVRNEDFPPYTAKVKVSADGPVTVRHRFGS